GAQPIFSWHDGEVNRVMVRITRQRKWNTEHYGFLSYCHGCGQFQTLGWKKLGRAVTCQCQPESPPVVSGPMWLGPLHSTADLDAMMQTARARSRQKRHDKPPGNSHWHTCQTLIATMQAEADQQPYHYPLAEIGRRGNMDIPPRQALISQLQAQGFRATQTQFSSQAIKTNAPISTCVQIARQISPES
ncbi:MAG: tRNA (guanine-N1)-methyltransferase, partial [Cyanobacteria bacterium P01_D01_bin.36]